MGCCGWNDVEKTPRVPAVVPPADPLHVVALDGAHAEGRLFAIADAEPDPQPEAVAVVRRPTALNAGVQS
jgi:hypothetical protein